MHFNRIQGQFSYSQKGGEKSLAPSNKPQLDLLNMHLYNVKQNQVIIQFLNKKWKFLSNASQLGLSASFAETVCQVKAWFLLLFRVQLAIRISSFTPQGEKNSGFSMELLNIWRHAPNWFAVRDLSPFNSTYIFVLSVYSEGLLDHSKQTKASLQPLKKEKSWMQVFWVKFRFW